MGGTIQVHNRKQKESVYDRRPIIELGKPKRTYRASRGEIHKSREFKVYAGWGGKETFDRKPRERQCETLTNLRI